MINVTNGKLIRLLVDDEPFDVRYGELRRARAGARLARRRAARASAEWGSPAGQRGARAPRRGWSRSPSARSRRSRYEVEPLDGRAARRRAVRAGRQRAAAAARDDDPRAAAALRHAAGGRGRTAHDDLRRRARAPHARAAGCGWRPAMDHVRRRPAGDATDDVESADDLGARHRRRRARAGPARCGWSSSSPTAGRRSGRCRRCATRSTAALAAAQHDRLGRPASPSSASTSTSSGTRADVEIEGDAELQQAVRFALFHVPAGRRARRAAGDPGQGPDRARLRRPRLLGHRDLRAAGADLHRARRGRATRCAGATRRSTWRASARSELGLRGRGVPVAHDPRRGVLGLLAGRHRRVPHQRRHRRRGRPLRATRPATTTFEREVGRRAAGRDRAAVALARPPRRRRAASASTASPGPTSTARVADNNVYTNLMAQRNLRGAADAVRAPPGRAPRELGRRRRGGGGLARRRRRDGRPVRRASSACTRRPRASPHHEAWDFDGTPPGPVPAAAALPVLRPLPQAGGQAGRPGAGDAPARRRVHRRGEGAQLRLLRGAAPCATRRCRRAPRR